MKLSIFLIMKYWKAHIKEVFSIVLSIAILSSSVVCSMLISRSQLLQEYNELLDVYGGYDTRYINTSDSIIEQFKAEKVVDKVGIMRIVGKIGNDDTQVTFGYFDENAEELMHYPMEKGTLPRNKGEIAIEKSTLSSLGITDLIGINIDLKIFDCSNQYVETKTFKLVGVIDDLSSSHIDRYNNEVSYNNKVSNTSVGNYPDPIVCVSKEDALNYEYTNIAVTYIGGDSGNFSEDKLENPNLQEFVNDIDNTVGGMGRIGTISLFANSYDDTFEDFQNGESLTKTSITKITMFFGILCFVISSISLFSVVTSYYIKKSYNIQLIHYCGMDRKNITKMFTIEAVIFFIIGVLLGLILGSLLYETTLFIEKQVFDIPVYRSYIVDVDFVKRKTQNPFVFATLISLGVCTVGFYIANRNIKRSLIKNKDQHSRKPNKTKRIISKTLNLNKQNILQLLSLVIVITFGSIGAVYLISSINLIYEGSDIYFYVDIGDDIRKTGYDFSLYREKYNDTNRFCAINTSTGLSAQDVDEISNNEYVQSVEAVLTDKTARFYIDKTPENATILNTLEGYDIKSIVQSGCESLGLDFEQSWADHNQYYESYGFDDSTTNYYYTSVVACNDTLFDQLEEYLVDGEVDVEGITSGQKVLIIEGNHTNGMLDNPFKVGDTIHLFNSYYSNESDWKNAECNDLSYFVDSEVSFNDVIVCGIINAPDNNIYQTLLVKDYSFLNNYTIVTNIDGYSTWNFAQYNYDSINIKLKDSNNTLTFQEKVLPKYITDKTGLNILSLSYGYKKIHQEIGKVLVQLISMLVLFMLVFLLGYINTISLQFQLSQKRFGILQALGMSRKKLLKAIVLENLKTPVLSTVISYLMCTILRIGYKNLYVSIENILGVDANTPEEVSNYQSALATYVHCQLNLQLHTYNIIPYILCMSIIVYIISIIVSYNIYRNKHNIIDTIKNTEF